MQRTHVLALAALVVGVGGAAAAAADDRSASPTGPSSSASPYLVATADGVDLRSIVSTGDRVAADGGGTYRMGGIPDGLGAFDSGRGTFTVLMNHEYPQTAGVPRAHGAPGAYVSKWTIRKSDLSVVSAQDLIRQVATWNPATSSWNAPAAGIALNRLCSANLARPADLLDHPSGKGYDGRIFVNGEEGGSGRAFAHLLDGTSYELPSLGRQAWENQVIRPASSPKTVVIGTDDSTPGQVFVSVGDKRSSGNPVERAGLSGGTLYGIKVAGLPAETDATTISGPTSFGAAALPGAGSLTVAQLDAAASAAGVTAFNRPEDGTWDPQRPNDFYFVTTASFNGSSRLFRLRFEDAANPALGGTIEMLLDGSEAGGTAERHHMLDNVTMNDHGQLILQEDPGNNPYVARVWQYDVRTGSLTAIARHDPDRFLPPNPAPFTQDEESSGVIDVSDVLGDGWYLLDVQAHYSIGLPELVEGGQLLAMRVSPSRDGHDR